MGRVIEGTSPTLFGGVSKQPPQVRKPNQVQVQDNALSSVLTGGFEKRPATMMKAKLSFLDATKDYFIHHINRDADTKLFVGFETGSAPALYVWDKDGSQKTVVIGDTIHNFVVNADRLDSTVNSGVIYQPGTTTSLEKQLAFAASETTFDWTWESSDATTFRFRVQGSADGDSWTNITTAKGGAASGSFSTTIGSAATDDHNYIRIITDTSAADTTNDTLSLRATFADMTYLLNADPEDLKATSVADYTFIVNRNIATKMEAVGLNDQTGSISSTVQEFSDLPAATGSNNIHKVTGKDSDGFGNFYVQDVTGSVWEEIVDPTSQNVICESTMPHQLVRSADGTTFTFSAATWNNRPAGNATVNPDPGFIGGVINDVTFYRNRLCFMSDETVYLSQAGDVFALFAAKATDNLDSDPIERGATTNDVNILQYGIAFRKVLFLTSLNAQFELDSGERELTPVTARLDQATAYRTSGRSKPANMGDVLFFPSTTVGSSVVYEYYFQEASFSNTALDISRHVQGYIPKEIVEMHADAPSATLFVVSSGAQNAMYVYRTFFDGTDKLQSAWSRYLFGADETEAFIHGFALFDGCVCIVIERDDGNIYMEEMAIEREALATGMPFMPMIDQREEVTGTYNSVHNCTHWPTTWEHSDDSQVVLGASHSIPGDWVTVVHPDHVRVSMVQRSAAHGETIVIGGKTFTAVTVGGTDTSAREFNAASHNIDVTITAAALVLCLNDSTDGIGADYLAVDNLDGTIDIRPLDTVDNLTLATPTGTFIDDGSATVTQLNNLTAARGDHSAGAAYVGRQYTMTVELSKIYPTENERPVVTGRLQLQDITTLYENTGYFDLKITPDGGRDSFTYTYEGKTLGEETLEVDSPTIDEDGFFGHKKVLSRADTVKIEYINATPEPCTITSVQWRGFFNETGRAK